MDSNGLYMADSATICTLVQSTNDEGEQVRIAELSRRADVPLATVKYYLREGLLPAGAATARNQAEYGDEHVRRLRLIRAMREVGELGIERIRTVLAAIDDESLDRHSVFGVAARALESQQAPAAEVDDETRAALDEVDRFLRRRNWAIRRDAGPRLELASALVALRRLGRDADTDAFTPYADVAERLADLEVASIPATAPPAQAVEQMVVGTIVFGAILDALRRLAHEHHSARR
jgi:DNA-binding transcriptional MerR regulator